MTRLAASVLLASVACLAASSFSAAAAEEPKGNEGILNVLDFGADPTGEKDSRQAFLDAIERARTGGPRRIRVPAGTYAIDNRAKGPLPIYSDLVVRGDARAAELRIKGPGFRSPKDNYLSALVMEDLKLRGDSVPAPGAKPRGEHAFELYTPTNNTAFNRVQAMFFTGDAWHIRRQTKNPRDRTGPGNVVFNQCFAISCWGYAFDVDGYVNAVWVMCDVNSCVGGAFHLRNGVVNQAQATIVGLWWEGNRPWTSRNPVWLENMGDQAITFVSCDFSGPLKGEDVITITGPRGANVNMIGCAGYTYRNWIVNEVEGTRVPFSHQLTYLSSNPVAEALRITGTSPSLELSRGEQSRWRLRVDGDALVLDGGRYSGLGEVLRASPASRVLTVEKLGQGNAEAADRAPTGVPVLKYPLYAEDGRIVGYVPVYPPEAW